MRQETTKPTPPPPPTPTPSPLRPHLHSFIDKWRLLSKLFRPLRRDKDAFIFVWVATTHIEKSMSISNVNVGGSWNPWILICTVRIVPSLNWDAEHAEPGGDNIPVVDPVDPIGPADPIGSLDPIGPIGPLDPIDPVDLIGPKDPIGPENPIVSVDPISPEDKIGPEDPIGPLDPIDPVNTIGPRNP